MTGMVAGIRMPNVWLPDSVVATRASSGEPWVSGDGRSVDHDGWLLCTTDGSIKKDDTLYSVAFDAIVDIGGVRLNSPGREHDLLTKKIMISNEIGHGTSGPKAGAGVIARRALYTDWFVRWRLSVGVDRNADLLPMHVGDYFGRLRSAVSISDLVPMIDRLKACSEEIAEGSAPSVDLGPKDGYIDWSDLASRLGIPVLAMARSRRFRAEVSDLLPVISSEKAAELRRILFDTQPPEERRLGVEGIMDQAAAPLRGLWRLTSMDLLPHDPFPFDPGPAHAATKSRSRKKLPSRTPTIAPPDLLVLMSAAAKWVMDYADHVLLIWDMAQTKGRYRPADERDALSLSLQKAAPEGFPTIRMSKRDLENGPSQRTVAGAAVAVRHLMTACAILVGSFGARRVHEITSLRTGCLEEREAGLLEMTVYIEKTLRTLDAVPVPAMMRRVVEVLEKLTETTRRETGKDWLFEVQRTYRSGPRPMMGFNLSTSLDAFAEVNGLRGGSVVGLRAHQLRRGFAVAYYHGFEGATLDALSRFLRHDDPEMTRVYINEAMLGSVGKLREEIKSRRDAARASMTEADRGWATQAKRLMKEIEDRGRDFDDVRCEALVARMLRMWDGTDGPIGQGAARMYTDLDRMIREAEADMRLGSRANHPGAVREPLLERLHAYAAEHFLEPVPGRVAHCTCRPDHQEDLRTAECLRAKEGHRGTDIVPEVATDRRPDMAFAGAYVCLSCSHCAAFADDMQALSKIDDRLADAVARGATENACTSAADRLASLRAAVKSAKEAVGGRA